jgi:hypothetical protein
MTSLIFTTHSIDDGKIQERFVGFTSVGADSSSVNLPEVSWSKVCQREVQSTS